MNQLLDCKQIFIAGTGRCGTTHISRLLGQHPEIYGIPFESRFVVDPGGLEHLVDSVSDRYTSLISNLALKLFDKMMRQDFVGVTNNRFRNLRLDKRFGEDIYYCALNTFMNSVIQYDFYVDIPKDILSQKSKTYWPTQDNRERIVVGKFFENREEILFLARNFVATLFGSLTLRNGKKQWSEQTPWNMLSMKFLWELFPQAKIIHIKRDPRGVFQSQLSQYWSSNEVEANLFELRSTYIQWKRFKENYSFDHHQYMEIKLEDLAKNTTQMMSRIQDFLETETRLDYPEDSVDINKVDYWKSNRDDNIKYCEEKLQDYFDLMGYKI